MSKLIFGCGYLGSRVAQRWHDAGDEVFVVTRSQAKAHQFRAAGYRPIVADVTDRASLQDLPAAETVLFAVGFDRSSGKPVHEVYVAGLSAALDALPAESGRVIYISSTGVYGQDDGSWVDEDSPCYPKREGGRACLAAEQVLAAHQLGARSVVLRMAGIYGPGRIPFVQLLRAGEPIPTAADGYLNLIHVEDAASVVLLAERREPLPALYCVSDGHPALRREYYAHLAQLIGAAEPTFSAPEPGSHLAGRASSDKRISNARLMSELKPALAYPSYREGLAAIVAREDF